jgi:SpoVK/Ycf46/Vps4 family AAA+-type ATPase
MEEVKRRLLEIAEWVKVRNKPYGVILFGPPGTGKTMIAKALANKLGWKFMELRARDVMSKWYGESEYLMESFFDQIPLVAPVVVLIDEIDGFAMSREGELHEVTHRLINIMLSRLQELHDSNVQAIIIGTTNLPQEIDEALLRPGRFDEVIYVPLPNEDARKELWRSIAGQDVDYETLAKVSNRLSPADIKAVAEAVRNKVELGEKRRPTTEDYLRELQSYKPSISLQTLLKFEDIAKKYSRHKVAEKPYLIKDVKWDDLGDLENVKKELREAIEMPIKHRELAKALGVKPAKGVLLYGPPGTGKTSLAKALASELNASFIILSHEELARVGPFEAPKVISEKFALAREYAPSILFIDEIDSWTRVREANEWRGALTELLVQMDGIRELEDVVVLATTNRPWDLDPALLRPGRFDKLIYVPPPDLEGRKAVLKVLLKGLEYDESTVDYVAARTEYFTPADLKAVVDEVRRNMMKEALERGAVRTRVTKEDFEAVLKNVKPSLSPTVLTMYETWRRTQRG